MQTLNLRLTRDNLSRPWGFRLQEESDTGYPFSVQRVFSGSPAEGILQRNDKVKILNNIDLENLNLKEVQDIIRTSGSQLNFIVERDTHKSINFSEDQEEKLSVQNTRLKFLNNENRSPQPFGQFGTQYQKKANTLPTSFTIESRNEIFNNNIPQKNIEIDEDDKADYSFMTLPVSERKKLFATPNENAARTMPRQRSFSFRPTQKFQTKTQSAIYQKAPHDFGWGPSTEKIERARNVRPNQSTVPLRYQEALAASPRIMKTNAEKVSSSFFSGHQTAPRTTQPNRRYSSSATIPGQTRTNFSSSTLNCSNDTFQNQYPGHKVKSQKYVYHCGRNNDANTVEPSIIVIPSHRQPQNLYVNTYGTGNQMLSPAQSPRYFRPAYPAYNAENSGMDSMSIISVRSEPYSKRLDKSIGYDKAGNYRIIRDASSAQRDLPNQMSTLQIGEPRTRIIANPASPSFHLNRTFWGPDSQTSRNYEEPVQYFAMQSSPIMMDSRPHHRSVTVPKSQSSIIMNPTRQTNDSVYNQVSWLKQHRDSMTGVSDF